MAIPSPLCQKPVVISDTEAVCLYGLDIIGWPPSSVYVDPLT